MNKVYKFLFFLPIFLFSQVIKFSPLPIDTANNLYNQYEPMLDYLSKKTGDKYVFVYSPTYEDLLNNFRNNKVDIIVVGALPYLKLKQNCKFAKPILSILNHKKSYYTCQLVTSDKNIKSLDDINKNTYIFLPSKLSTCGYLMTEYIFQHHNKNLHNYNYRYVKSHINVIFNTTLEYNSIGSVKSDIANEYKNFIYVINTSIKIPEFSMVVNTNKITIKKQKQIITILKNKYPMIITPKNFYKKIEKIQQKIKVE